MHRKIDINQLTEDSAAVINVILNNIQSVTAIFRSAKMGPQLTTNINIVRVLWVVCN